MAFLVPINSSYPVGRVKPIMQNETLQHALHDAFEARRSLSGSGYFAAGIILAAISVVGIVNNFCVVLVIIKDRRLRTPINLMLLSLSLSKGRDVAAISIRFHEVLWCVVIGHEKGINLELFCGVIVVGNVIIAAFGKIFETQQGWSAVRGCSRDLARSLKYSNHGS